MSHCTELTELDFALAHHNRQIHEARLVGHWTGRLIASFAGADAKEKGLVIDNPFNPSTEPNFYREWDKAYRSGYATPIPSASIATLKDWKPRPGTTACARAAFNDEEKP